MQNISPFGNYDIIFCFLLPLQKLVYFWIQWLKLPDLLHSASTPVKIGIIRFHLPVFELRSDTIKMESILR